MNVDIICPLYNAEKYIEAFDKSIKRQKNVDINKIRYVLTKSKDRTEEILKQINATYKVIEPKDFSHSSTREKEAFESDSDILVFVTQDVIIKDEMWLYNLIKDIESGKCEAAYSRQICDNNSIEKYTRRYNYPKESCYKTKADIEKMQLQTFFFSDAASAIKRETFVKLKGYDGKVFPTNEDMYISYKLIMNGYTIKYEADSEVMHSHDFTYKEQYKRYYDTGKFFYQNSYFDKYKVKNSGFNLAMYVLKSAIKDMNFKAIIKFVPNMLARYFGMRAGKRAERKDKNGSKKCSSSK